MQYFLFNRGFATHTVERSTILKILTAKSMNSKSVTVVDIYDTLRTFSDEQVHFNMRQMTDNQSNQIYVMPEVPLNRMERQDYYGRLTKLHPLMLSGGTSVLAQVIAITGHQPSRYDNLVSAFAAGHIKALRAAGATDEEVKEIALRDRLLRSGGLYGFEERAESMIALAEPLYTGAFRYHMTADAVEMSILDHHLSVKDIYDDLSIVFLQTDDEWVVKADIYTTDFAVIDSVKNLIQRYDYQLYESIDERTRLHFLELITSCSNRANGVLGDVLYSRVARPRTD